MLGVLLEALHARLELAKVRRLGLARLEQRRHCVNRLAQLARALVQALGNLWVAWCMCGWGEAVEGVQLCGGVLQSQGRAGLR
eukprot:365173-Chlamydomonas_euryale.AAC.11